MATPAVLVDAPDLERFGVEVLTRLDVPRDDALDTIRAMLRADLRGVHTHGMMLLPIYVPRVRQGGINPRPNVRVIREQGAVALLDDDHGFGHVGATRAMRLAMERAARHGIGAAGVRSANHYGAASAYALLALERGQIGISSCNSAPCMAPTGGASAVLGNNPLAVAIPAGAHPPIVLDMATSTVAGYKIFMAARRGEKIPLGWALDRDGRTTDDPNAAWSGMLTPVGGVKGYGLAVVLEALDALLTGAAFGVDVPWAEPHQSEQLGFFFLAIDVAAFMPLAEFTARVDAFADQIKASRLAPGSSGVFLPGELEHALQQERLERGIPFEGFVWDTLTALAAELRVAPPSTRPAA